jgi:hypothetical protein
MSFTDTERAAIRAALGYPQLFKQEFYRLESAMDLVGSNPEQLTLAQTYLDQITTIETGLTSALATSGMKKAEDIEWYDGQARITGLRKEGRRLTARLSNLLGVEKLSDAFGEGGYQGDAWITRPPFPWSLS